MKIFNWISEQFYGEMTGPAFWIVLASLSAIILNLVLRNPPSKGFSERGRSNAYVIAFCALCFLIARGVYPLAHGQQLVLAASASFLVPGVLVSIGVCLWLKADGKHDASLLLRSLLFSASYFSMLYFASHNANIVSLSILVGVLFGVVVGGFVHVRFQDGDKDSPTEPTNGNGEPRRPPHSDYVRATGF